MPSLRPLQPCSPVEIFRGIQGKRACEQLASQINTEKSLRTLTDVCVFQGVATAVLHAIFCSVKEVEKSFVGMIMNMNIMILSIDVWCCAMQLSDWFRCATLQ